MAGTHGYVEVGVYVFFALNVVTVFFCFGKGILLTLAKNDLTFKNLKLIDELKIMCCMITE